MPKDAAGALTQRERLIDKGTRAELMWLAKAMGWSMEKAGRSLMVVLQSPDRYPSALELPGHIWKWMLR
jgi:hypothetical protein